MYGGQLSLLFNEQKWSEELGHGLLLDLNTVHIVTPTGGGLHTLRFRLPVPQEFHEPHLAISSHVRVSRGIIPLGTATIGDVDETSWTFTADGIWRHAETVRAESADGTITLGIREAIDVAIADGRLDWAGYHDTCMPNAAETLPFDGTFYTVAQLLNNYTEVNGGYWYLDGYDVAHYIELPAEDDIQFAITPGVPIMATGNELLGPTGTEPNEKFVESLPVAPGDLTTPGSTPIDLWAASLLVLGKRGMHHGVFDRKQGQLGKTTTWVIGSCEYHDGVGGGELVLGPIDLAPRSPGQVIDRLRQQ